MSLRDIFSRARSLALEPKSPVLPHGVVMDTSDDTLVAIGTYAPPLLFLSESMMDTRYVPDILSADAQRIKMSDPRTYPEWSWNSGEQIFKKTNPVIITEYMRERAVLAAKKVAAISTVIYYINLIRSKVETGFFFQAGIYAEKERQARAMEDANFDELRAAAAPYVVQYADANGISLRRAAEEILLQAQLDHDHLAKTEKLRLVLFKKIRSAKTVAEIEETLGAFHRDGVV